MKMIAHIKSVEHVNGIDASVLDEDRVSIFVNDNSCDMIVDKLEGKGYKVETFYSESFIPIIYYSGSYYDYIDVDELIKDNI